MDEGDLDEKDKRRTRYIRERIGRESRNREERGKDTEREIKVDVVEENIG